MPPAGILGSSSFGRSATIASVVSISEATEAAFCSAVRETFAGSIDARREQVLVGAGGRVEARTNPCPP
jgi:hypothetical protein